MLVFVFVLVLVTVENVPGMKLGKCENPKKNPKNPIILIFSSSQNQVSQKNIGLELWNQGTNFELLQHWWLHELIIEDYKKIGQTVLATLLSHDDGEFEQGLLDELVQPAVTVLCQSTAVYKTLIFIRVVWSP